MTANCLIPQLWMPPLDALPAMRADRLLTMNVVGPWRSLGNSSLEQRIPVLMYHSISASDEDNKSAYYRTTTHPDVFFRQMSLLKAEGYVATGITRARELLLKENPVVTEKLLAITFDDGFRDFYTHALPVLMEQGFSATMYLPTAFISNQTVKFKGRECLTWEEVRESGRAGIELGSHTVNHPKLYEVGLEKIRSELADSKSDIEQHLGETITAFAYPYAFPAADSSFVKQFCDLLGETGYKTNVTTSIGRMGANASPFTIPRLPANSADDDKFFLAKIRGAYDWMNWPQHLVKKLKNIAQGGRRLSQTQSTI